VPANSIPWAGAIGLVDVSRVGTSQILLQDYFGGAGQYSCRTHREGTLNSEFGDTRSQGEGGRTCKELCGLRCLR